MKIFQTAMGEAQEEAGSALLPILSKLASILVVVATWIGENTTMFLIIAGVIATVAAAILAANAAIAIYNTVTTIAGIVSTAAWGAALLPILLVIAAVLLVVGAVVLLWRKSETFRGIVIGVWNAIKTSIEAAWNWVGNLIGRIGNISVPGAIETAFVNIKGAVEGAWNKVGDLIAKIGAISIPGTIKTAFDNIATAIGGVRQAVEDLIGWISRIHWPKFPDLPGGKSAPAEESTFRAPRVSALGARAAASSSSPGISIVVNGALDPEATARQIRRILAGHDRRMGLAG
jgi:hypothetical protein